MTKRTGSTPAEREAATRMKQITLANARALVDARKRYAAAERAYLKAGTVEQAAWAKIAKAKPTEANPPGTPEWQAASKKLDQASNALLRASDAVRLHEKEQVRIESGAVYTELVERITRETERKERQVANLRTANRQNAASRKAAAKSTAKSTTVTKKETPAMSTKAKTTKATIEIDTSTDKAIVAGMVELYDAAIVDKDADAYRMYRRFRGAWLRRGEGRTIAQAQEQVRKAKGIKAPAAPAKAKAQVKAAAPAAKKAAAPKAAAPKNGAKKQVTPDPKPKSTPRKRTTRKAS